MNTTTIIILVLLGLGCIAGVYYMYSRTGSTTPTQATPIKTSSSPSSPATSTQSPIPVVELADPISANPLFGKNTSDEGSMFNLVDKAWRGLTSYDKITMNLPSFMMDPAYHIAFDPNMTFMSAEPTMTAAGCDALCRMDNTGRCTVPVFLSRANNICYARKYTAA